MTFELISPDHPLYPRELELRFRILREPLGQGRDRVQFPFERESLHLVAVEQGEVVGCVLFHPETPSGGRLFQMAVRADLQRGGLGRRLVEQLEAELVRRGVTSVHLHARQTVTAFYERLGYACYGDPFTEVGLPHRHMRKALGKAGPPTA